MKLNPLSFALAAGILWGVVIMVATWFLIAIDSAGDTIVALRNFYFGYRLNFLGSIFGLIWGFVYTFVVAFAFAWLYNKLVKE